MPTTRWSEVARAADADPAVRRAAIGGLIVRYLPAFRAHLTRHHGLSIHYADDVLQGFVCDQVVATELIGRADRARGRLRGYLLGALRHYLSRVRRGVRAKKRAPARPPVSLSAAAPDESGAADWPVADDRAGGADAFDIEWARQVLAETAARMSAESSDPDRARVYRLFDLRVFGPVYRGDAAPDYARIVRELGFASPSQASNALVTGKRTFARLLRGVIAEYAADPAEVEEELADLWRIASTTGPGSGPSAVPESLEVSP